MAENKIKFSTVIPCYNAVGTILETILSVLSQRYEKFEVIIIDDASTDGSLQIIEHVKDSRLKLVKNRQNSGRSFSRNRGIMEAVGDRIVFLDSDDLLLPQYFSSLNERIALATEPIDKTILYSYCRSFNSKLHITWTQKYDKKVYSLADVLKANTFPICGLCFPTQFLKNHSLEFNTSLETYEDWLFIIHCLASGGQIAFSGIPEPICLIRVHGNNTMKKRDLMAVGLERMRLIANRTLTKSQAQILFVSSLTNRGLLLGFKGIQPHLSTLSPLKIAEIMLSHCKYCAKCSLLR